MILNTFRTQDPIKSFALPIKGLEKWYEVEDAQNKRRSIAKLIRKLMSQDENNSASIEDLPHIKLP